MTNDLEKMLRSLEEATAPGDAPAVPLDPETASLREAWLAFGEILEAAQPPIPGSILLSEAGPGLKAVIRPTRPRRRHLVASGLIAASLLIAAATFWTLRDANRQGSPTHTTNQAASNHRPAVPAIQSHAKGKLAADAPQWDDSLDEPFAQIDWQMLCFRENESFRTDAFGLAQYRISQFRQAIETDSL